MSKENKQLYIFGEFRLDPDSGLLFQREGHVPLAPKILKTLVVLVEHGGSLLTKDELMKAVWPDTFVEEGNLTVNIHALRKVLGDHLIETIPRRGYRFAVPVQTLTVDDPAPPARRRPGFAWAALVASICVLALTGVWLAHHSDTPNEPPLVRLTENVAEDRQPDVSPDGRSIVFVSNRDGGKGEIYAMDADGSNPRNVTNNPANDDSPAWSPDGRQIAFQSNRRGPIEIFVMNAGGGNPIPLAPGGRPAWSPDGRQLVFNRVVDHHPELFAISLAGGEPRRLTFDQDFNADASWSPDGKRLAFTSSQNHTLQITVMGLDGHGRAVLTSRGNNRLPAWSPDGRRIVFNSDREGKDSLYIMEADGALQRRITQGNFDEEEASWTRDGRSIVFESERDGNTEIYRMHLLNDPDGAIRLTRHVAADDMPSWSPDGKWIAFQSNREGKFNIFVMDPQGNGVRNLTHGVSRDTSPAWSHNGKKIAFSSDRGGSGAIYTMNADGGAIAKFTEGSGDDMPHWSPDGTQICFSRDHGVWIASTGAGARRVATGESCAWSPDGERIIFDRDQDSVREIYSFPAAGGETICLTKNGRGNGGPAWIADGSWIAFNSNRDGFGFGIFLMKPDGTAQTRISGRSTFDEHPSWSPDGRWIAFSSGRDGNREIYKIAVP